MARFGYAARGIIYTIVGLFAVLAGLGSSQETDAEGALRMVLEQPLGWAMMCLLIVGLVGYVIWRSVQSLLDTDDHGYGVKGLAVRGGLLASAVTYSVLAVFSLSLLGLFAGGGGGGGDVGLAKVLAGFVGRRWVTLGLALVFGGVALAHWWKAVRRKYADHFEASDRTMALIHPISIVGLLARGLVFAGIAAILVERFVTYDADGTSRPGLAEVLDRVQELPMGSSLLIALGVGLMTFAAYSFCQARWRQINVEDA
ncbi:MAG: DUF1206 domain-containing protein [Rhodospirillales bacterium]